MLAAEETETPRPISPKDELALFANSRFEPLQALMHEHLAQHRFEDLSRVVLLLHDHCVETISRQAFVANFFPVLFRILSEIPCQFEKNVLHDVRKNTVEIFRRVPLDDHVHPCAMKLLNLMHDVLEKDNEKNAVNAVRLVMDIHKRYMKEIGELQGHSQRFLDYVKGQYRNFSEVISHMFCEEARIEGRILRGVYSAKVLTECPLVIVFLFQAYSNPGAHSNLDDLLKFMEKSFARPTEAPPIEDEIFRRSYADLIGCKVKTASFLAYTLRVYDNYIAPYKDKIPRIVTQLLLECPPECIQARKELLVIIRHMIDSRKSNLRRYFLPYIEKFLTNDNLIGEYCNAAHEHMRPLAYSTLADLIHHVRNELNLDIVAKTVTYYTRIMYDASLKLSIQTMAAKLLVHLVEAVFASKNKTRGKEILSNIMEAFVTKVSEMSEFVEILDGVKVAVSADHLDFPFDPITVYNWRSESSTHIRVLTKTMVKTLILGLKNVVYVLHSMDPTMKSSRILPFRWAALFTRLFEHGIKCFTIYDPIPKHQRVRSVPHEAKENITAFASLFGVLPSPAFEQIITEQLPLLYRKLLENEVYLKIPVQFLQSQKLTATFSGVLIRFLLKRIPVMAGSTKESKTMMKLFQYLFLSLMAQPQNEAVLQPYLQPVIRRCLTRLTGSSETYFFLYLLRSIFRCLICGKFDALVDEILPYLSTVVVKLTELLQTAPKGPYRDLVVELLMSVPAKIHVICPHMPQLMRPIFYALDNPELAQIAMRNLELWANSLQKKSFEPMLRPIVSELLTVLFQNLKPKNDTPTAGTMTLKLLAKMGPLTRGYSVDNPTLEMVENPYCMKMKVRFVGENDLPEDVMDTSADGTEFLGTHDLLIDKFVPLVREMCFRPFPEGDFRKHSKVAAIRFLQTVLLSMLDGDVDLRSFKFPDVLIREEPRHRPFPESVRCHTNVLDPASSDFPQFDTGKCQAEVTAEETLFRTVLKSCFEMMTMSSYRDEVDEFNYKIIRFFASVYVCCNNVVNVPGLNLHTDLFLDALIDAIMIDQDSCLVLLEKFLRDVFEFCAGHEPTICALKVWARLMSRICHACYQRQWKQKLGGCGAMYVFCSVFPAAWLKPREQKIIWALLFAVREVPEDVTTAVMTCARQTIHVILNRCNRAFLARDNRQYAFGQVSRTGLPTSLDGRVLNDVFSVLVTELNSPHPASRNLAVEIIERIAEISQQPPCVFTEGFRQQCLEGISHSKVDPLPLAKKRGTCEMLSYFMKIHHNQHPFKLPKGVIEVLEMALATVKPLMAPPELHRFRHSEALEEEKLELSCLRMLGTFLNLSVEPQAEDLQRLVLSKCFELLHCPQKEVISIVKDALQKYSNSLQGQEREQLGRGILRQLLELVKDFNKKTVITLKSLLSLLPSYFAIQLSQALLQRIHEWIAPIAAKMDAQQPAPQPTPANGNAQAAIPPPTPRSDDKVSVGAQLIEMFSLLPWNHEHREQLPGIVTVVLKMEQVFKDYCTELRSPFRRSLSKICNMYPKAALDFFMSRVAAGDVERCLYDEKVFHLLISMIDMNDTFHQVTRLLVDTQIDTLHLQLRCGNEDIEMRTLLLIWRVARVVDDFFVKARNVIPFLRNLWRTGVMKRWPKIQTHALLVHRMFLFLKCFVLFFERHRKDLEDVDILFDLVEACTSKLPLSRRFLVRFFLEQVPLLSDSQRLSVYRTSLDLVEKEHEYLDEILSHTFHYLFNPMLIESAYRRALDDWLENHHIDHALTLLLSRAPQLGGFSNMFHVEICKTFYLFVKWRPESVSLRQKDVYAYFCNEATRVTSTHKHCAHIVLAEVFEQWGGTDEEVLAAYKSALKAHNPEGRSVSKRALDLLLPHAMGTKLTAAGGRPKWEHVTTKRAMSTGSSIQKLAHLWMFVVRHREEFSSVGKMFMFKMLYTLAKIGVSSNLSFDNRKLSMKLANSLVLFMRRHFEDERENRTSLGKRPRSSTPTPDDGPPMKKQKTGPSPGEEVGKTSSSEVESGPSAILDLPAEGEAAPEATPAVAVPSSNKDEATLSLIISDMMFMMIKLVYSRHSHRALLPRLQYLADRIVGILNQVFSLYPRGELRVAKLLSMFNVSSPDLLLQCGLRILTLLCKYRPDIIKSQMDGIMKYSLRIPLQTKSNFVAETFIEFVRVAGKKFPPVQGDQCATSMFHSKVIDMVRRSMSADPILARQATQAQGVLAPNTSMRFLNAMAPLWGAPRVREFAAHAKAMLHRTLKSYINKSTSELRLKEQQSHRQFRICSRSQLSNVRKMLLRDITRDIRDGLPVALHCIDFLSNVSHFDDGRTFYAYLLSLSQILEHCDFFHRGIVHRCLCVLEKWMCNQEDYSLTLKQKAYFLQRLCRLDTSEDVSLKSKFFKIVRNLYEDEELMSHPTFIPNRVESLLVSGFVPRLEGPRDPMGDSRLMVKNALNSKLPRRVYDRLVFITQSEHWEYLKNTYWITLATELLLDVVDADFPLSIGNFARVAPLFGAVSLPLRKQTQDPHVVPDGVKTLSERQQKVLRRQDEFLLSIRELTVGDLIAPLRILSLDSLPIAKALWISMFKFAWTSLSRAQRKKLHKPLLVLMARDYHSSQYLRYPNVIQALLEGVTQMEHLVPVSPEQLRFLGKSFNCWNVVLPFIEKKLAEMLKKHDARRDMIERFTTSLTELYRTLGEDDMLVGIWRCFGVQETTKRLFSMEQLSQYETIQKYLVRLFKLFHEGSIDRSAIYHSEISLWEDHWLRCTKKLLQWEELLQFGKKTNMSMLTLECHWNNGYWAGVGDTIKQGAVSRSNALHVYQISYSVMENRVSDAFDVFQNATQGGLQRWCALPTFHCPTHDTMLHNFQQLVELYESSHFLSDNYFMHPTKISNFFVMWNDRHPNRYEDISMWNEILNWRFHFLEKMAMCSIPPTPRGLCMREAAFSVYAIAATLRRNRLLHAARYVAKRAESVLNASNIRAEEDAHLLSQLKSCQFAHAMGEVKCLILEKRFKEAFDLINSARCFSGLNHSKQVLQVLRVKGQVLRELGETEQARKCFSNAVSQFPEKYITVPDVNCKLGKVFLEWAKLHDQLFVQNGSMGDAEQAVIAYMQALRFKPTLMHLVPRLLDILMHEDQQFRFSGILENSLQDTPHWVFLPWIESVLSRLQRELEYPAAKAIVDRLAIEFPQAIYYLVRSIFRDLELYTRSSIPHPPYTDIATRFQQVIRVLFRFHGTTVVELENCLTEFDRRLIPSDEEETYRSLITLRRHILLIPPDRPIPQQHAARGMAENIAELVLVRAKSAVQFCSRFFQEHFAQLEAFLKSVVTEHVPAGQILVQLSSWIGLFQTSLHGVARVLSLESVSRALISMVFYEMEVPGQYLQHARIRPMTEVHEKIIYFLSNVELIEPDDGPSRVIHLHTSNGRPRRLVLRSDSRIERQSGRKQSEYHIYALMRHIDSFLRYNYMPFSRKILRFRIPTIVPIRGSFRIHLEEPNYISLEEIFKQYCHRVGRDPTKPIDNFWEEFRNPPAPEEMLLNPTMFCLRRENSHIADRRVKVGQEIAAKVPKTLMMEHLDRHCPSWSEFFQIRKQVAYEIATMGVMRHLLNINIAAAKDYRMALNSASLPIVQVGFIAQFSPAGLLKPPGPCVPMRLTRNVRHFLSPFVLEGSLLNTVMIVVNGLVQNMSALENELRLFFRNELVSWRNVFDERISPTLHADTDALRRATDHNIGEVKKKIKGLMESSLVSHQPYSLDSIAAEGLSDGLGIWKYCPLIEQSLDKRRIYANNFTTFLPFF